MSKAKKQILFATGAQTAALSIATTDTLTTSSEVSLADELARRVNAWFEAGKIEYSQYDLFRRRLKEQPAVSDVKLDGNVLVLAVNGGEDERIFPDDANLDEVVVVDSLPLRQKVWNWIKSHAAISISGGVLLVLLVVLLIKKLR